jgi:predicted nucleic-acid-binding Zn-ribbon protein
MGCEREVSLPTKCSHCGGTNLYRRKNIRSLGWGIALLDGLGWSAKFDAVICADCGLAQYFDNNSARARLRNITSGWRPI